MIPSRGQIAAICVLLAATALLAISTRISCSSSGAGSISIKGGKAKPKPASDTKPVEAVTRPGRSAPNGR
jgi:hypothetical protein